MSAHEDTQKLTVLAVDDERPGLEQLQFCLRGNRHVGRIISAVDATEALRLLGQDDDELRARRETSLPPVDVVFSDLKMPGLSGLEMSSVFAALSPAPLLVFVTGHPEQAVHAFDLGAVDYVLKPCNQQRLDKAMDRVLGQLQRVPAQQPAGTEELLQGDDEVIPVELAGTTKLIPRTDVRWVEAQGDYARLYTAEGSHLVRIPLAQLEQRWERAGFVRIHRSYLVAVSLITELRMSQGGYQVVLGDNEKTLPVSRRHTRELKDRLVGTSRSE